MTNLNQHWDRSPEQRIIREVFLTKEGGMVPGSRSTEYGRVLETVLLRELQLLALNKADRELRFARGYVVDDYAQSGSGDLSASEEFETSTDGPRFDIVCYRGEVAWSTYDGLPMAVVPMSKAIGVIEVKRTLSPGYFPTTSNRAMNEQFIDQQRYLESLGLDVPFIVIGAHYSGSPDDNRQSARADHVALLGDLADSGSAVKMARKGELRSVIDYLETGEKPLDEEEKARQERVSGLQDIARDLDQ
ncbi:hypothetical protein [Haloferax volcanii]|uniref:hypothetical protein n=1 Tax=Haloferax volcanii TaxID=2246 RepID=UPI00249CB7F5|nr:hypothetical protein [Haloferax alexandrinus]